MIPLIAQDRGRLDPANVAAIIIAATFAGSSRPLSCAIKGIITVSCKAAGLNRLVAFSILS